MNSRSVRRALARAALPAVLILSPVLVPTAAVHAADGDCGGWFPDFHCEREARWDGFHLPVVAPYLFEDPFITTGAHAHGIYHDFPENSIFDGGHLYALALQVRVAITERLAFIATKDGYVWNRPNTELNQTTRVLDDTQGNMNIAAGFKYALYRDDDRRLFVTPALRFEIPVGSEDTFQGYGDGLVIPSISAAWGPESWRLMASFGSQIPFDGGQQSANLFYHLYAGYDLHERLVPFVQLSGITWVHSGDGQLLVPLTSEATAALGDNEVPLNAAQNLLGTGRFEGAAVINLGSRGVAGQDLFTWAVGGHVPLTDRLTFTAAFERPFSHQKGIFKNRLMTTLALEF